MKYKWRETIGAGGSSLVRACECRRTGARFACKSVAKRGMNMHDIVGLCAEVRAMSALAGLDHVVQLREVMEDSDSVYLVMELYEGGDLFKRIAEKTRLKEPEAALFFRQIVRAVAAFHSKGWVHRDLKPENILLRWKNSEDGEFGETIDSSKAAKAPQGRRWRNSAGEIHVGIADFGLSVQIGGENGKMQTAGSPSYMAPEVVAGLQDGAAADVWSLGVILYAMLSGSLPFRGKCREETFNAIKVGKFDVSGAPWPSISTGAVRLVRRMLARDPAQRPTAGEVLQDAWLQCEQDSSFRGGLKCIMMLGRRGR